MGRAQNSVPGIKLLVRAPGTVTLRKMRGSARIAGGELCVSAPTIGQIHRTRRMTDLLHNLVFGGKAKKTPALTTPIYL